MNWLGENIRAVIVSHLLFTLDPTADLQQDKEIKLVHIHILFVVFFSPQMKHLHLTVTPECALLKQVVWWSLTALTATRQRCERAEEKQEEWCKTTPCKSWSLYMRHHLRRPPAPWPLPSSRPTAPPAHLSLSSSPSFSRLVMTSTSACLVSQKDGDLWECFGKINVDRVKPNINDHN